MKPLIPKYIHDHVKSGQDHGFIEAYTMFLDLSGFTSLTERLMQEGNEGAEELSMSLNSIFEPMVKLVYDRGGFIPYFAGDAFHAVFELQPGEDKSNRAMEVVQTARALSTMYEQEGLKKTRFGEFKIGLKVGVAFGQLEWGVVGNGVKTYYFRGSSIEEASKCQVLAEEQDVVVDENIQQVLLELGEPGIPIRYGYYAIKKKGLPDYDQKPAPPPELDPGILGQFLPEAVLNYEGAGEFRTVVSLFISFQGVHDHTSLNALTALIMDQVKGFSGYFKEVDFGDKGGVMVAFFGAPISFENNVRRALECVLSMRTEIERLRRRFPDIRARAGVTSGIAYTGIVGGRERCQYAAVGNRVNIAARLMMNARWGQVLVDEEIQKESHFRFLHRGNIRYKGIEAEIPTYELLGHDEGNAEKHEDRMIGRQEELERLEAFVSPIFHHQFAGLVYLFGEAGIGKSRMVYEMRRSLDAKDFNWYIFQADQILRKPFNVFTYFFRYFLEQSPDKAPEENFRSFRRVLDQFEKRSRRIKGVDHLCDELVRTRSVLAALVGLQEEGSLWSQLDAKGRRQNTVQAIVNFLHLASWHKPLIIELEDAHWFDESSREVVEELVKVLHQRPVVLLVTSRPEDDGRLVTLLPDELLERLRVPQLILELNYLSEEALQQLAEEKLMGPICPKFLQMLKRTSNGNPFYAQQLLEYFSESDLLVKRADGSWDVEGEEIRLSNSINNILTARIDRLSTLVKETVKAAAVIGREFELPILSEVMQSQSSALSRQSGNVPEELRQQIQEAEQGQIWRAMNELRYIFKHSLLREAAYDMQLRARLRKLHRLIAQAIEKLYGTDSEERYADLAFHYEQAEELDKAIEYLEKTADYFRNNYQNEDALTYYDKLLKCIPTEETKERCKALMRKGGVHELVGEWELAENELLKALDLARESEDQLLMAQANNELGELMLLQGNYDDARMHLNVSATYAEMEADTQILMKVYGSLGDLYFRQGVYDDARTYFIKSLEMGERIDQLSSLAKTVANLGLTFMNQGKYEEGIQHMQKYLEGFERKKDKMGMATLYTNLGIVHFENGHYDNALECYKKGLEYSSELGNKQLQAIAIGCMGSVYQQKGDFSRARELFLQDLEICEQLGDKQGISIAHGLLGELYSIEGKFELAIRHLETNLEESTKLGYQKGIAKAINSLGDVYYFMEEHNQAASYYQKAIDISRSIDNMLVLGQSLLEKAAPLLAMGEVEKADELQRETVQVAERLSNRALSFEAQLLKAKILRAAGKQKQARQHLLDLQPQAVRKTEQAAVEYQLWKIDQNDHSRLEKALQLYRELQAIAPTFLIRHRVSELEKALGNNE